MDILNDEKNMKRDSDSEDESSDGEETKEQKEANHQKLVKDTQEQCENFMSLFYVEVL